MLSCALLAFSEYMGLGKSKKLAECTVGGIGDRKFSPGGTNTIGIPKAGVIWGYAFVLMDKFGKFYGREDLIKDMMRTLGWAL